MPRAETPIEMQDFIDDIVRQELSANPTVESDWDKVINIYGILGLEPKDAARIIGVELKELSKISEQGINPELRQRLDKTFAYASILQREIANPQEITRVIKAKTPFLKKAPYSRFSPERSPLECMRQGDIDLVLLQTIM